MYLHEKRTYEMPKWLRKLLTVLRGSVVALIVILLIGPLIRSTSKRTEKPIIIIAQDNSSSIPLNKDSTFYRTGYLNALSDLQKELSKDYEVRNYVFGTSADESEDVDFQDGRTDLSDLFNELDNVFVNRNVGAVKFGRASCRQRG